MPAHLDTGQQGENSAAAFLQSKGYSILATNWRSGRREIDIIAEKAGLVVFVEVKTRSGWGFGWPEEAVNAAKQMRIAEAAEAWLEAQGEEREFRFDVISIIQRNGRRQIYHIEDAFAP